MKEREIMKVSPQARSTARIACAERHPAEFEDFTTTKFAPAGIVFESRAALRVLCRDSKEETL